jgi:DNA-binding MarR family transcriptional regulator/N-acetylglutamate synthase-like GNAT family acetyltransferase
MNAASHPLSVAEQVSAVRDFNRFYTARLGLLQKRYLNGEFSLTESRILYEIWANPRLTASTLRGTLKLDAGYISRLLASLTRRKLVRQTVSKLDTRERLLSLTSAGEKKVAEVNRQAAAQIQRLLHVLSPADRDALVSSLAKVRSLLAAQPDSGIQVVRLSQLTEEARSLLHEYYESVGVVVRDTPEAIQRIIDDPKGGVWVAHLNGKAVGCAYLRSLPSIPSATECKRMYVKPSARGNGVAHALLDAQEAFAKSRGLKRIYLDSKDDLKVAIAMYARRGFVPCEQYNHNPQATVFMVKTIEGQLQRRSGDDRRVLRKRS